MSRSRSERRRGRLGRRKPLKCQRQMKGAGKFNLPTFPTNVTFGFRSDKLSAGELFPSVSFSYPHLLAGNLKVNGLERSLTVPLAKIKKNKRTQQARESACVFVRNLYRGHIAWPHPRWGSLLGSLAPQQMPKGLGAGGPEYTGGCWKQGVQGARPAPPGPLSAQHCPPRPGALYGGLPVCI